MTLLERVFLLDRPGAQQTTILSADKDLLQLVSDRTLVWDAMRGKRYTQAGVEEKLGVPPDMVADYLALVGDARAQSHDSRAFGPVERSALAGRAVLVLWSRAPGGGARSTRWLAPLR